MLVQSIPYPADTGPVIGAAPTSTRWRVYFPSGASGSADRLELNDIYMRATSGGANIAAGQTYSSTTIFSGSLANLFDSNSLTVCSLYSGADAEEWIEVQFASAVSILELAITGSSVQPYWNPAQVLLKYDNGSTWVTVYTSPVYNNSTDWPVSTTKTYTFTLPSFSVNPSITNTSGFTPGAVPDVLSFTAGTYSGTAEVTYAKKRNGTTFDTTLANYTTQSGDTTISLEQTLSNPAGTVTATASFGPIAASPTYAQDTRIAGADTRIISGGDTRVVNRRTA